MQSPVKQQVLVACPKGTAHKRLVRLRRYEWSDADDAFVRVDGEADEVFLRRSEEGVGVEMYARPEFKCPVAGCGRSAEYETENFQKMLHRAAAAEGVLFI